MNSIEESQRQDAKALSVWCMGLFLCCFRILAHFLHNFQALAQLLQHRRVLLIGGLILARVAADDPALSGEILEAVVSS